MPRSSNDDDYMDYWGGSGPSGGPGGSAGSVGQGGLGGSHGSGGRSGGGSSRGSANDYHAQGGPGGNFSNQGGLGGGGYDGPSFAGSGTSFADSGSTYGDVNAGGVSFGGNRSSGPSDAGMDSYFAGPSPVGVAAGQGGLAGAVGGSNRNDFFGGGLGAAIGSGLGSRSTYGAREAGGLAVSNPVGRGLGRSQPTQAQMEMAALLAAIAIPESGQRWGAKYRDKDITDFSDHPRTHKQIPSGPNKGKFSSASGPFQFIEGTWDWLSGVTGVKDFSHRSNVTNAVALAKDTYDRLGRNHKSLEEAIAARDFEDLTRVMSDQWEGVRNTRAGRAQFARDFENELAKLAPQDHRTGAHITDAAQVFTNPDGSRVATPASATFTTEQRTPTTGFVAEVLGHIGPASLASVAAEVPSTQSRQFPVSMDIEDRLVSLPDLGNGDFPGRVPVDFPTPQNPGLWTNPYPGVDLEDRPGSKTEPTAPTPRGLNVSTEPSEPTFEQTYLNPASNAAVPTNAPVPQQRGNTTVRDVSPVPSDWQRPTGDRWAGARESDVGFGDYGPGDPWRGLREVADQQPASVAEQRLKSIGGRLLSGTIDSGLALLPGVGLVNLASKLATGRTIGQHIVAGEMDVIESWANSLKGEGTSPAFGEATSNVVSGDDPGEDADVDDFVATYLTTGQSNPSPAVRWGRL